MTEPVIFSPTVSGLVNNDTLQVSATFNIDGDYLIASGKIRGTSNHTSFSFTLPFVAIDQTLFPGCKTINNGVVFGIAGEIRIQSLSNVAEVFINGKANGFTHCGTKGIEFLNMRIKIK